MVISILFLIGGAYYGRHKTISPDEFTYDEQAEERSRIAKAARIKSFLEERGSELSGYSYHIASVSGRLNVDPYLVVAISGIESSFCKQSHSYNCWGLGGSNFMRFDSYEESIEFTARLLAKRGDKEPERIVHWYCPSSDGCNEQNWISTVNFYQNKIKNL